MIELIKNIKFTIGVISTIAIMLSAFRFEILDTDDDDYFVEPRTNSNKYTQSLSIDKKVFDFMSKFERNIRHLNERKGYFVSSSSSNNDECSSKLLNELKEAIAMARKVTNEFQQLVRENNQSNNYNYNDNKSSSKKSRERRGLRKNSKTISYSLQFGSKIYMISLYWPKLLEVFFGID